jgi:hypothetical protein
MEILLLGIYSFFVWLIFINSAAALDTPEGRGRIFPVVCMPSCRCS